MRQLNPIMQLHQILGPIQIRIALLLISRLVCIVLRSSGACRYEGERGVGIL